MNENEMIVKLAQSEMAARLLIIMQDIAEEEQGSGACWARLTQELRNLLKKLAEG